VFGVREVLGESACWVLGAWLTGLCGGERGCGLGQACDMGPSLCRSAARILAHAPCVAETVRSKRVSPGAIDQC
jgi:hypothetical protein